MKQRTFFCLFMSLVFLIIFVATPVSASNLTYDKAPTSSPLAVVTEGEDEVVMSRPKPKQKLSKDTQMLFSILALIVFISVVIILSSTLFGDYASIRAPKNRKEARVYKDEYRGDIPLDGDLLFIFYFYQMKDKRINRDHQLLGACLLQWIMDGSLLPIFDMEKMDKTLTNHQYVKVIKAPSMSSSFEKKLWRHISASAKEQIIDDKSFTRYMEDYKDDFFRVFHDYYQDMTRRAKKLGLMISVEKRFGYDYLLTDQGLRVYTHVQQFFHYLDDFARVRRRNRHDAKLWKDYLVLATAFDLGKQVALEIKPQVVEMNLLGPSNPSTELDVFVDSVAKMAANLYQIYNRKRSH